MSTTSMPGHVSHEILLTLFSLTGLLNADDPAEDSKETLRDTKARDGRTSNPQSSHRKKATFQTPARL